VTHRGESPSGRRTVGVFIVCELQLYGEGLAHALDRYPGIRVLGCATTDIAADIQAVREIRPDVVLVDMTVTGGVSAVRAIRGAVTGTSVIALAVPETAEDIVEYAEVGISGYVTRNASLDDLVQAIQTVAEGEIVCPGPLAATLVRRVEELAVERSTPNGHDPKLTHRELELLQLIEQGLSNLEIAERLVIALPTVKNHLHTIFAKLDVRRRSEAAALVRLNPALRVLSLSSG
jgi:two-component system, NarL family, nitrate/nitrite response regulator NarL